MYQTFFNWSSGKDAALALFYLQQKSNYTVDLLITTVNQSLDRVSMHGLRSDLLDKQVACMGIPLKKIYLPEITTMDKYSEIMKEQMTLLVGEGYTHAAFGDIFLEDLRKYREQQLQQVGIKAVFPIWNRATKELMSEFLDLGFKAITVSTNAKLLGKDFVGRVIDRSFLKDLPKNIDACGENGEFHSFVFDGPIFNKPVDFEIGEKVKKHYNTENSQNTNWDHTFWYCDLLPK